MLLISGVSMGTRRKRGGMEAVRCLLQRGWHSSCLIIHKPHMVRRWVVVWGAASVSIFSSKE